MAASTSTPLLNQAFADRLRRLLWTLSRLRARGGERGRSTSRTGGSHAFEGHRPYTPGDDPRHVDWNAVGRTDQVVVKVFGREEETTVDVLLDHTASMATGHPAKLETGRQLAAAMGFLALHSRHRLRLGLLDQAAGGTLRGPFVGLESAPVFLGDLERVEVGGARGGEAGVGLKAYLDRTRRPGAVVIITDGLEEGDLGEALAHLGGVAGDSTLFHLLSPQELDPPERGRMVLEDVEGRETLSLHIGSTAIARYRAEMEAFRAGWQRLCHGHGVDYRAVSSADPLEGIVVGWHQARHAR